MDQPIEDLISGAAQARAQEMGLGDETKPYVERRDSEIKKLEESQKENPGAALVGTIAGSVLPMGAAAKGAKTLGQAIKSGVITGSAYGALSNPGDVEGEVAPIQAAERGRNSALGALTGGTLAGVARGVESSGKSMNKWAKERAFKALGGDKAQLKRMGEKKALEMGGQALEDGVIGKIPRSTEKLAERAKANADKIGQGIGSITDELAEQGATLDKYEVGDGLLKKLVTGSEADDPQMKKLVENRVYSFLGAGGGRERVDIKTAQQLKEQVGKNLEKGGVWKALRKGDQISPRNRVELELYDSLSEGILDAASTSANPAQAEKLERLRNTYANYKLMRKTLDEKYAKEVGNRLFSPTDYAATGVGTLIGATTSDDPVTGALKGAAVGLGHKALRTNMSQPAAKAAYGMSKQASKLSQALSRPSTLGRSSVTARQQLLDDYKKSKDSKVYTEEEAQKRFQGDQ
jgi:hypothetical protein